MPIHSFTVNGKRVRVECAADVRMLWVLRDLLGINGPKYGCGLDVCRACTCFLNGESFNPCAVPVSKITKHDEITTIEGLPATVHADLHPMQQAWLEYDVAQCGYCQPGQIMNAIALANQVHAEGRAITEEDLDKIRNICRCGTYARIREAILAGAAEMAKQRPKRHPEKKHHTHKKHEHKKQHEHKKRHNDELPNPTPS